MSLDFVADMQYCNSEILDSLQTCCCSSVTWTTKCFDDQQRYICDWTELVTILMKHLNQIQTQIIYTMYVLSLQAHCTYEIKSNNINNHTNNILILFFNEYFYLNSRNVNRLAIDAPLHHCHLFISLCCINVKNIIGWTIITMTK